MMPGLTGRLLIMHISNAVIRLATAQIHLLMQSCDDQLLAKHDILLFILTYILKCTTHTRPRIQERHGACLLYKRDAQKSNRMQTGCWPGTKASMVPRSLVESPCLPSLTIQLLNQEGLL